MDHASCTTVRLHAHRLGMVAGSVVLLGNAPSGSLPNTLRRWFLVLGSPRTPTANRINASALALVSSLFAGGISAFNNQGSGISDLSSPNALRLTLRPWIAPFARPSSSSTTHNRNESLPANTLNAQPYELALQAASRPIREKGPCATRLRDGKGRLENLQKRLSGAFNVITCLPLPFCSPAIHNDQLCMLLHESLGVPPADITQSGTQRTQYIISKKDASFSSMPEHHTTGMLLACCAPVAHRPGRAASKPRVSKYTMAEFKGVQA